jgi:hypothetical protein
MKQGGAKSPGFAFFSRGVGGLLHGVSEVLQENVPVEIIMIEFLPTTL